MKLVLVSLLLVITVFSSAEVQENKADFALKLLEKLFEEKAGMKMAREVEERRRGGEKEQTLVEERAAPQDGSLTCPTKDGLTFRRFGTRCLALVKLPMRWHNAAAYCSSRGSHLVTIRDAAQNQIVTDIIIGGAWIGLSDHSIKRIFLWQDDTWPIYTNWFKGEPNNAGGEEDCVEIYTNGGGKWNDRNCVHKLPFVCQTNAIPTGCPRGYEAPFGRSCYKVVHSTANWFNAGHSCARDGATLVSLETRAERRHIESVLNNNPQYDQPANSYKFWGYWISANDLGHESFFSWSATGRRVTESNWQSGDPNNHKNVEHCAQLSKIYGWRWVDNDCRQNQISYICEKDNAHCS